MPSRRYWRAAGAIRTARAILVTRGAGFIGSHMVLDPQETGEPIIVHDDPLTGFPSTSPLGVEFVKGGAGDCALQKSLLNNLPIAAMKNPR